MTAAPPDWVVPFAALCFVAGWICARLARAASPPPRLREGLTRSQVKWPTGHPVPPPPPPGRGVRGRTVPPPLRRPDDVATLQRRIVDLQAHASDLAARLRAATAGTTADPPPPGTTRHTVVACRCWPCNAPGRGPQ